MRLPTFDTEYIKNNAVVNRLTKRISVQSLKNISCLQFCKQDICLIWGQKRMNQEFAVSILVGLRRSISLARKGENIYKRKDGRWEGRYIIGRKADGRARYASVYGNSYRDVKDILERKKGEQYRTKPNCSMTVQSLMETWLFMRDAEIKCSTYQRYQTLIENHIVPRLGKIRVRNLTAEIVAGFVQNLLKEGRLDGQGGLSKKTVSDIVCILRSAIKLAGKRYEVRDIDLYDIKGPVVKQKQIETLCDGECDALVRSILAELDLSGVAYLLALCLGLRIGEVCGLKWSDVYFADKVLIVNRTVLRIKAGSKTKLIAQTPKTDSAVRRIPLPVGLISLLSNLRKSATNDAYILSGLKKPLDPRTLYGRFQRFLQDHGIRHICFHTLRHTFATRSIESGADIKTVSELLGHSNVKTTLQLYVHPTMAHKREIVEASASFLPTVIET